MATPTPDTKHFQEVHMEICLEEDVAAELDDFLLLRLLGIDDEAKILAQNVLWTHLRHFSVFAEVVDYAIETNDTLLQTQILRTIRQEAIEFPAPHEATFLDTVVRILEHRTDLRSYVKRSLVLFQQWDSPILCQALEIKMNAILPLFYESDDALSHYAQKVFDQFLARGMLQNATRCFSILVVSLQIGRSPADKDEVKRLLRNKFDSLMLSLKRSRSNGDVTVVDQIDSDIFVASISYLMLVGPFDRQNTFGDFSLDPIFDLLLSTKILLLSAFQNLPDTTPRGRHYDFCMRIEAELQDWTPRTASTASTILEHYMPEFRALVAKNRPAALSEPGLKIPLDRQSVLPISSIDKFQSSYSIPQPYLTQSASLLSPSLRSKATLHDPHMRLSAVLQAFIALETLEECRDFYRDHLELDKADIESLEALAAYWVSQGHPDIAKRAIERYIMLRDARVDPYGGDDYMRRLVAVRVRKERLASESGKILKTLEEQRVNSQPQT